MNKSAFVLMLSALALLAITEIAYGGLALIFPLFLFFLFISLFFITAMNAHIQIDANPGIERISEPDFWFSSIYNAWLYKTNIEKWARYVSTLSLAGSAFFGTIFGGIFLLSMEVTGSVLYVSWLTGFFFTGAIAFNIATAKHWAEKAEATAKYEA